MADKNDKYNWTDADICIKCETVTGTPKGNGLRMVVCKKCKEEFDKKLEHWREHGLYCGVASKGE